LEGLLIYLGDCIEVLKTLPDNSVDSVVTDPPYGLEFMGKEWDKFGAGISPRSKNEKETAIWKGENKHIRFGYGLEASVSFYKFSLIWALEVLRVLKPGGHLLSFGGTRTYHRMACAIEDAGFEIRDQMQWLYGSGFPKSFNIGKNCEGWDGWGSALKPANEPICVARKPLSEKNLVENVLKWGTGGINIDGCRVDGKPRLTGTKDINAKNGSGNVYLGSSGAKQIAYDANPPSGRFPANLILDEEAGQMLDEMSGNNTGAAARASGATAGKLGKHGIYNGAKGEDWEDGEKSVFYADKGGASRFFYCAKASRSERNAGLEGMEESKMLWSSGTQNPGSFQSPNTHRAAQNHHPTVKPISLMRYLCRLVTPPKGTVLDPFMGSGTTGCAASLEGFEFIGIEREAEYMEIAERRIAYYQKQPMLL
jgi:DNA modification methylase